MMRIGANPEVIELRVTEILGPDLPRPGDVRLEFAASVDSFAGSGFCWVGAEDLEAFAASARALQASLTGVATLESLSPGEMTLSISMANRRGYVQIAFACTKLGLLRCSMSGTFEVELAVLADLIAWVEHPMIDTESS